MKTLLTSAVALTTLPVIAEGVILSLQLPDRIKISERTNLSRREDGRYVGLMNRQVIGYLTRVPGEEVEDTALFTGRMLAYEETLRDMDRVGRPVDDSYRATLAVHPHRTFTRSDRVVRYLGIPTLPDGAVDTGETWSAPGQLVIALPNGTAPIVLEVQVRYQYAGLDRLDGELVYRIEAEFATRYPPLPSPNDEGAARMPLRTDIDRIAGRHSLTILLPANSAAPYFVRDEIEEEYEVMNGPTTLVRGHTLLFIHGLSLQVQQEIAQRIVHQFQDAETEGVVVEQTDVGIRVTVKEIRFVADQAVLLAGERDRLDQIAAVLQSIPDVRFLIVGHTADIGTWQSQLDLSWRRAEVIVGELVRRGLSQIRFDLEGRGGAEPSASNETESGRAINRRVEIYILEE